VTSGERAPNQHRRSGGIIGAADDDEAGGFLVEEVRDPARPRAAATVAARRARASRPRGIQRARAGLGIAAPRGARWSRGKSEREEEEGPSAPPDCAAHSPRPAPASTSTRVLPAAVDALAAEDDAKDAPHRVFGRRRGGREFWLREKERAFFRGLALSFGSGRGGRGGRGRSAGRRVDEMRSALVGGVCGGNRSREEAALRRGGGSSRASARRPPPSAKRPRGDKRTPTRRRQKEKEREMRCLNSCCLGL